MRLYLIRHAEPDYERDGITPRGRREARALAKFMLDTAEKGLYKRQILGLGK